MSARKRNFGRVYCDSGEIGLGIYESGEMFGRSDGDEGAAKFWDIKKYTLTKTLNLIRFCASQTYAQFRLNSITYDITN